MKAKSFFFAALFSLLAFTALPVSAASNNPGDGDEAATESKMTEKEFNEALDVLKERVDVLKEAKKNAETKEEKQKVKDEIKEVKKEAKELKAQQRGGAGIYIGGGALLVIILLLLLL